MAIGITRDLSAIKRFVKEGNVTIYLKQVTSDGTAITTGDGTQWNPLGTMKGTKVDANTTEYSDQDDTGKNVVDEETINNYVITTTLMQRDENTRLVFQNTDGLFYLAALTGATIGTKTEAHVFGVCKVSPKHSYEIGGAAQYEGVTIRTLTNSASLSVTLPTQIGSATLTINIGKMWTTDDV
jgi:hypothetical protein